MNYLNKYLFLACFVYLILSQKILDLTSNIKNLLFFNKWQCYVVFKKRHQYQFIAVTYRLLLQGHTHKSLGTAAVYVQVRGHISYQIQLQFYRWLTDSQTNSLYTRRVTLTRRFIDRRLFPMRRHRYDRVDDKTA